MGAGAFGGRRLGWVLAVVALLGSGATTALTPVAHGQVPVLPLVSAQVMTQPSDSATGINPIAPVRVSVRNGVLDAVALTNPAGNSVAGQFAPDRSSWTVTEPLAYATIYTWSGTATGIDRQSRAITGSFQTVIPELLISGRLNVADNSTYGIAMPIALTFSSTVIDKAAVQNALSVHPSVPTEGSWAWLDDRTVHWRPKTYFAPHTRVSVTAKLYGLAMGAGAFGRADIASTFTIGRSYLLRGDTRTHRLVAYAGGVQVADYPASYGLDSDPGRATHSGTHVVMSKHPVYYMSNPRYHYQDIETHWAVRISNNGEFTHSAPWSVADQGRRNVSHGCVNLSLDSAKVVYDAVLPGDPVEIIGSTRQLGPSDGDYYDWTIPWATWVTKSALPGHDAAKAAS
ncbi:MAG: L,D-transpeptidase [Pseudonocardiaceae bacterium]